MPKVTYDLIEPNIADLDVQGNQVRVTWKCPVTGKVVAESGSSMRASVSTSSAIQQSVMRTIVNQILGVFVSSATSLGGFSGKVARAVSVPAQTGALSAVAKPKYTEANRQTAVVEAFGQVESQFKWDDDRDMYVGK